MSRPREQVVRLHVLAPPKPAPGSPCNGCGVCCAAEPCPIGRLRFLKARGACPALAWRDQRYRCDLVERPTVHLPWLPTAWAGRAGAWIGGRIAAGKGCDSDAQVA